MDLALGPRPGVTRGYPYHRIEDAYYARNAEIKASAQCRAPAAIIYQTLDEFIVESTGLRDARGRLIGLADEHAGLRTCGINSITGAARTAWKTPC